MLIGRRSSGWNPRPARSMTNCPARASRAIAGHSRVRRKWSRPSASCGITGAAMSDGIPAADFITTAGTGQRRGKGRSDGQPGAFAVLPSGAVTFPKLVVHAALAGLYGGLVVALFLRLANPAAGGPAPTLLFVVLAYTLAAAAVWPGLYAALRFFASHRFRLYSLSL